MQVFGTDFVLPVVCIYDYHLYYTSTKDADGEKCKLNRFACLKLPWQHALLDTIGRTWLSKHSGMRFVSGSACDSGGNDDWLTTQIGNVERQ